MLGIAGVEPPTPCVEGELLPRTPCVEGGLGPVGVELPTPSVTMEGSWRSCIEAGPIMLCITQERLGPLCTKEEPAPLHVGLCE